MMKRSYSDMSRTLSVIPEILLGKDVFKSILTGSHKLRIKKLTDISKPEAKPIEEIEEPEEEATATELKLNKSNARMIQLELEDGNNSTIGAIETERIDMLTDAKPDYIISLQGPIDVRCARIMLEKKHVVGIEVSSREEEKPVEGQSTEVEVAAHVVKDEPAKEEPKEEPKEEKPDEKKPEIIDMIEDWDEEDEDDCIILN